MSDTLLRLVTFANEHTTGHQNWIRSARRHQHDFCVLGMGTKWYGFMTKIRAYQAYCEPLARDQPYAIVAIVDCYDLIVTSGPSEVVEKFRRFDADIVISAERMCEPACCYPDQPWATSPSLHPHRFLNSGCIVGFATAIYEMLTCILQTAHTDDQWAMGEYVRHQRSWRIKLDFDSCLSGTYTGWNWSDFDWDHDRERIVRCDNHQTPCFLHTPGSSGDRHYRYNRIGRSCLGGEFEPYPVFSTKGWCTVLGLLILVLLFCIWGWRAWKSAWPFLLLTLYVLAVLFVLFVCRGG